MPFFGAILVSWVAAVIATLVHAKTVVLVSYWVTNPAIILALYAVTRVPRYRLRITPEWGRLMNWFMIAILVLNAPGSIFLHDLGIQYDRFLHFTAVLVAFPSAMVFLAPIFLRRHPKRSVARKEVLAKTFLTVFVGLFLWEAAQWSVDQLFGTQLYHDATQTITRDAIEDVLFGVAGLTIAAFFLLRSPRFLPGLAGLLKEERLGIKRGPAKPV